MRNCYNSVQTKHKHTLYKYFYILLHDDILVYYSLAKFEGR